MVEQDSPMPEMPGRDLRHFWEDTNDQEYRNSVRLCWTMFFSLLAIACLASLGVWMGWARSPQGHEMVKVMIVVAAAFACSFLLARVALAYQRWMESLEALAKEFNFF